MHTINAKILAPFPYLLVCNRSLHGRTTLSYLRSHLFFDTDEAIGKLQDKLRDFIFIGFQEQIDTLRWMIAKDFMINVIASCSLCVYYAVSDCKFIVLLLYPRNLPVRQIYIKVFFLSTVILTTDQFQITGGQRPFR